MVSPTKPCLIGRHLLEENECEFIATTNQFETVFRGSLKDLTNRGNVIVLREKEPRLSPDGAWTRTYAYADGHSENHLVLDGNFEDWEAERSRA